MPTSQSGLPHWWRAMYRNRSVVIVIVPVTARPKANARAVELLKVMTSVTTEIIKSQLIHGT